MPFVFETLDLPGVILGRPRTFGDNRGFFRETWKASAFEAAGIAGPFTQDNLSYSRAGTVRGLHFQRPPHAQGKLVQCVQGSIWDVAVDIRPDSPTFGCWAAAELTAEGGEMLYIPEDFAHGFQVLTETALVAYKCTREFHAASEGGIRWNDPDLAIAWPNPDAAVLSERDGASPWLAELFPEHRKVGLPR